MSIRQDKDLIGQQFGRLTVIAQAPKQRANKGYRYYWQCQCECGNTVTVREDQLLCAKRPTRSCGCIRSDSVKKYYEDHQRPIKHGHSYEPLFNIWYLIKYRCENPNCTAYKNYGARGIKVCDEWRDGIAGYESFKEWSLANGYIQGLSIDRIDNDGDYTPDNCRWIAPKDQARNKRQNVWIEYNGVKKLACDWASELNIPYKTFMSRIYHGWDVDKLINQPMRKTPKQKAA